MGVRNRLVWPGVRIGVDVEALRCFRAMKDEFFATDPSSPLTPGQRARFRGLAYYPPNPELAVEAGLKASTATANTDDVGNHRAPPASIKGKEARRLRLATPWRR